MPVDLFFQLLMRVVRLTRLAPRVARILGIRVSGRADRDIRLGSYILYGVGIALAVAYFVYYLLGLQVDQSGRLLHDGAAVGLAEIFRGNFVIVSVVLLVGLNMVPYRRLQLPAAAFALALVIISILSLHVIGGCSYAFSSAELLMEGGSRRSGRYVWRAADGHCHLLALPCRAADDLPQHRQRGGDCREAARPPRAERLNARVK